MPAKKTRTQAVDPEQARHLFLQAIAGAPAPVSRKVLGTLPELGGKMSAQRVGELLAQDLARGQVFNWGTAKSPLFWDRDLKTVAHERLMSLSASEILTGTALDKQAAGQMPKLSAALVKTARAALQREGRLRVVAAAPGSKGKRFVNTEHPGPYLASEIARLLESFGVARSSESITKLLGTEQALPEQRSESDEAQIRDVAEKMFAAMSQIAFAPGTTVTFYRLRQQPDLVDVPKRIFDRAALMLQRERRALLGIHDHAAALSAQEQEPFVTDGLGHFYVSIYAR